MQVRVWMQRLIVNMHEIFHEYSLYVSVFRDFALELHKSCKSAYANLTEVSNDNFPSHYY
jgi:hypothetical protein